MDASGIGDGFPLVGIAADRFVSAAPLIVAAVCSDGVALIATHSAKDDEPLLLLDDDDEDNEVGDGDLMEKSNSTLNATNGNNMTLQQPFPKDLPKRFRGPFRIHSLDRFGSCLVCAGWRADGEILADYCRSLAASEVTAFGEPQYGPEYGQYLAAEASLWMARCAVSDEVRVSEVVVIRKLPLIYFFRFLSN